MVKSSASSGKSVIASVLAAEWSRSGRVALVCHSKRQQRRAVLRMVVEMKARFKGEGVMSYESGVEGATWVMRGGVGAVMVCTIDGLLGWCVMEYGEGGGEGGRKIERVESGIVELGEEGIRGGRFGQKGFSFSSCLPLFGWKKTNGNETWRRGGWCV